MSTEATTLGLVLEGPLQSWGHSSEFNRRDTGAFPTRSALCGILLAAKGIPRGTKQEAEVLAKLNQCGLELWAIHRYPTSRLRDYHTVGGGYEKDDPVGRAFIPHRSDGKPRGTELTDRFYLTDSRFAALFSGPSQVLEPFAAALRNPTWGVWLGRKSCIPAEPVFRAIGEREDVLKKLVPKGEVQPTLIWRDTREGEVGSDVIADVPLSFDPRSRRFGQRSVTRESQT